ncbi:MAG TPA: hypothetical protein VKU77_06365 [Streptosporangiaceae bacterium]|nr:hypothetical protein [Streptosporangiaceae bacterium]
MFPQGDVREYGQDRIGAIDFVEGAVKLGEAALARRCRVLAPE